jgi:hypothetical protein
MGFYRFIKLEGMENKTTGFFVPRMYKLHFNKYELRNFGFWFIKERLKGNTIWWVENEADYRKAIETLKELKKTRIFDYKVLCIK